MNFPCIYVQCSRPLPQSHLPEGEYHIGSSLCYLLGNVDSLQNLTNSIMLGISAVAGGVGGPPVAGVRGSPVAGGVGGPPLAGVGGPPLAEGVGGSSVAAAAAESSLSVDLIRHQ